jgi:hypothetical protein
MLQLRYSNPLTQTSRKGLNRKIGRSLWQTLALSKDNAVPVQTIKSHVRLELQFHASLTSATEKGYWSVSQPWPLSLTFGKRDPSTHRVRMSMGRSRRFGEEKNFLSLPGTEPQLIGCPTLGRDAILDYTLPRARILAPFNFEILICLFINTTKEIYGFFY